MILMRCLAKIEVLKMEPNREKNKDMNVNGGMFVGEYLEG
jgi:hypothetical protein